MGEKIDFVITWVDGNNLEWQKERILYAVKEKEEVDNGVSRFRDWDTLRYWFRGVEKFAPWVNNVFFITCGHLPKWININHPKLKVVKHSDFIPTEYLPTFSSNVIELYFHKIDGLSDKFVFFNDDFFLLDYVRPERFFKNGLPCDLGEIGLKPDTGLFGCMVFLATDLINKFFSPKNVLKNNFSKWFSYEYPLSTSIRNLILMRNMDLFPRFVTSHLPQGYLKKVYDEVWSHCEQELIRTSHNKFRAYGDVAPWLIRYWQLVSGSFTPYNIFKDGSFYVINDNIIPVIMDCIIHQKKKLICLNDSESLIDFEGCKSQILEAFNKILPQRSSFENAESA